MCNLLRVTELPFISSVEQFCFMERMNLLSDVLPRQLKSTSSVGLHCYEARTTGCQLLLL